MGGNEKKRMIGFLHVKKKQNGRALVWTAASQRDGYIVQESRENNIKRKNNRRERKRKNWYMAYREPDIKTKISEDYDVQKIE